MGLEAHSALAASLCAGTGPGCYSTIQQALSVAQDGDVIHVAPGTYLGPLVITKSVKLLGAGAARTIINGGGTAPVVRIGVFNAPTEPSTVSISGVTITGGDNTSDFDPFQDFGGGISVEPPQNGPAGVINISNSVITGNSVRSLGGEPCGSDPTPTCSLNYGGGISNFGTMTLTNTVVSNNSAAWNISSGAGLQLRARRRYLQRQHRHVDPPQ